MSETEDDDLTPEERAALRALPLEAAPPAALEERVVAALRDRGLLRRRPRPHVLGSAGLLRLAAEVLLFAAGLGMGAAVFYRPPTPSLPTKGDASPLASGPLFLLLLYAGPGNQAGDEATRVAEYGAWAASLRKEGRLLGAERLGSERRVLGGVGGEGEPAVPRGYFLFRASGLEEALEIARSCPHLRHGGQVSVQPIDPV